MKKAAVINVLAKYSNVLVGLLFSAILARILTPDDYGVVAVVTVFTTFFSILADMGIGSAIVQNKELSEDDENSIFSFSLVLALILGVVFVLLSVPISNFYSNNVYLSVCPLLAISVFFNTLNMVPNAKLMKAKKFLRVGIRTVVVTIVTYVIAIALALIGLKYYALIIQSVSSAVLTFFWNNYGSNLKLTKIKMESIDKIKSFFAFQFGFDILNYFARNLDNLLTGKFMGEKRLAYYDKGYKMMLYPINNLTFAITPVLHPILSDHQKNSEFIYQQYIKVVKILSLIGIYITTFCFFSSSEIILIMFGDQWIPAIKCFQILSISVWCQMISTTAASIYKSLGRTDTMFKSGLIHISISVIMIVIGVLTRDILIMAALVVLGLILKFFVEYYFLVEKAFKMSVIKFYQQLIPDMVIGLVLIMAFCLINVITIENILISFIYKLVLSAIVFFVMLIVTKQMRYLILILPQKIVKKLPRWMK